MLQRRRASQLGGTTRNNWAARVRHGARCLRCRTNRPTFSVCLQRRQAAQTLAAALPVSKEQALALVKSGFTNLEGLRDADVQDLVDILAVDETKAREIYDAVHRQEVVH